MNQYSILMIDIDHSYAQPFHRKRVMIKADSFTVEDGILRIYRTNNVILCAQFPAWISIEKIENGEISIL